MARMDPAAKKKLQTSINKLKEKEKKHLTGKVEAFFIEEFIF